MVFPFTRSVPSRPETFSSMADFQAWLETHRKAFNHSLTAAQKDEISKSVQSPIRGAVEKAYQELNGL